jgi:hypothetical protein
MRLCLRRVCLSVCPLITTLEWLSGFSWNVILRNLRKFVSTFQFGLKSDNNNGHFTWRRTGFSAHGRAWWGIPIGDSPQSCATTWGNPLHITQPDRLHWPQTALKSVAPFTKVHFWLTCQNYYTIHTVPTFFLFWHSTWKRLSTLFSEFCLWKKWIVFVSCT